MSSKGTGAVTGGQDEAGGLVPKLRFPEFSGAWHPTELTPHLKEHSERVPSTTSIPIYSSTRSGLKPQNEYFDGVNLANDGEYRIVPKGYFTFRHMSDDGTFKFNVNNTSSAIAVSKEYPVFTAVGLSAEFLLYILNNSADFARFALMQKKGGTRTRLYLSTLRTWTPLLPSIGEQQKIADCLSSIDTLIAAEAEKLEALKDHKKGLLQQLFPAPGETTPRLRFPEFKGGGEWDAKSLGSSAKKVGSGVTPKGGNAAYSLSGRPFMRSQNVGWGELLLENVAFIDEKLHATFPATEIRVNDVLLNITGASIGRSAIADSRISGGNVNQHVCIIRLKETEMAPSYLNQFLLSPFGQSQIDSFQAGGNRQGLNFEQIRSFEVPCPPALYEQERIADCLASIDRLVAKQNSKIEALKAHKNGLMQQLFPAADEVQA